MEYCSNESGIARKMLEQKKSLRIVTIADLLGNGRHVGDEDYDQVSWSPQEHAEKRSLRVLVHIEQDFRSYYNLWLREMVLQREAVEKLWHLTQRYMIIMRVDDSCKCPQIYAIEPEETIIAEYNTHYQVILGSNKAMQLTLGTMRPNVLLFRRACSELDFSLETPFILGDAFHKPIKFFMVLVEDLFKYFHSNNLKLNYSSHQLDPLDMKALENYRQLLEHSEEFEEYLMTSLTYCKCLQPPEPCPPRQSHSDKAPEIEMEPKSKRRRCAQRRAELLGESEPTIVQEPDQEQEQQQPLPVLPATCPGLQAMLNMSFTAERLPSHLIEYCMQ